ncbi:MAG: putative toxin-antitoxin system toxin component, PIN family [Candidatus Micrarchaeota archaeon]
MPRLFLDTNVLISATFWEGSSYNLLLKIADAAASGFTTRDVLQEYRIVLKRDFALSEEGADTRIEMLLRILTVVSPHDKIDMIREDPSDNRILEGALESRADFIVSYDEHLLKLESFRGMEVVKPEDALKRL